MLGSFNSLDGQLFSYSHPISSHCPIVEKSACSSTAVAAVWNDALSYTNEWGLGVYGTQPFSPIASSHAAIQPLSQSAIPPFSPS